jgi:hypothetical protein
MAKIIIQKLKNVYNSNANYIVINKIKKAFKNKNNDYLGLLFCNPEKNDTSNTHTTQLVHKLLCICVKSKENLTNLIFI